MARGDLAAEIASLKAEPGGDIIAWGGASFVQGLSRACVHNDGFGYASALVLLSASRTPYRTIPSSPPPD